ncbi:MAG TPA: TerC family protein [Longimicrobiales bacterium]|nr:TerC family protein [Longimicrobiales bacterium]
MDWIASPEAWISLLTLTTLEIVLGIDNIVFIAILADRLEEGSRAKARKLGLALAVGMRVLLLLSIVWIMGLTQTLFTALGREISGRDLILIIGGIFLLSKATREIHHKLEGEEETRTAKVHPSFASVIVQIMLLDIVFSLDSVITAVGVADHLAVMILAVLIAGGFMIAAAGPVSDYVSRHPTVKMLALSFLLLIGMSLVAEGMHQHIPKGYIYFAMGFSIFVEMLNLRIKSKRAPVHLRGAPSLAETRKGEVEV